MVKEQVLDYYFVVVAVNILSFFSCIFIIALYVFAKSLRNYAFKLVLCVTINDLIRIICSLFPIFYYDYKNLCTILGFIFIFTFLGSILWTLVISLTLYQVIIQHKENFVQFYLLWMVSITIYSFILCFIPLLTNSYGLVLIVCTLKEDYLGSIYKLSLFYGTAWVAIAVIIIIYSKINSESKKQESYELSLIRIKLFPMILIFCILPMTILRILQVFNIYLVELQYIADVTWALHGFFNSIAYGMSPAVLQYIKLSICKRKIEIENDSFEQLATFT